MSSMSSQVHAMLSFKLESLTYQNRYKMRLGEQIVQSFVFSNDGKRGWPEDTCFVFSGQENHLGVVEEIYVGPLPPGQETAIDLPITMLEEVKQERFQIEYEFRHQFQTQSFGPPIKYTVLVKSQEEEEQKRRQVGEGSYQ